jgi:Fe2+ transport system protein B
MTEIEQTEQIETNEQTEKTEKTLEDNKTFSALMVVILFIIFPTLCIYAMGTMIQDGIGSGNILISISGIAILAFVWYIINELVRLYVKPDKSNGLLKYM